MHHCPIHIFSIPALLPLQSVQYELFQHPDRHDLFETQIFLLKVLQTTAHLPPRVRNVSDRVYSLNTKHIIFASTPQLHLRFILPIFKLFQAQCHCQLSFASHSSRTPARKATSLVSPAFEPQPCQSASASSAASVMCLSTTSPRSSSFSQHFLLTTIFSPLLPSPPHTQKIHHFSASTTTHTAPSPTTAANGTVEAPPSLLPRTHYPLRSPSQSLLGSFCSEPCVPSQAQLRCLQLRIL